MKAKENTGVFEEHFTLGTSLSGKEQLSKKTWNKKQSRFWVLGGDCVGFFVEFFSLPGSTVTASASE